MLIFDAHNDTLLKLLNTAGSYDLKTLKNSHVNLEKLQKGTVAAGIFAIYVPSYFDFGLTFHKAMLMVDLFWQNFQTYDKYLSPLLTSTDLIEIQTSQKIGGILSLEGGEALEGNLGNLRNFHRLGVRALSLTWNNRNSLGDGVGEGKYAQGLSRFGHEVVEAMNELGMIVDVSHLSEKGFWDVLAISNTPVIASHSNCRVLCNHPRNLWDQQIKSLADTGGVIGINFYPNFLNADKCQVNLESVIDHIIHLVNVGGSDCVGLGSDFDGITSTPKDLEDISKLPSIIDGLRKRKVSESNIEKIMGKNFFRVIQEIFTRSS